MQIKIEISGEPKDKKFVDFLKSLSIAVDDLIETGEESEEETKKKPAGKTKPLAGKTKAKSEPEEEEDEPEEEEEKKVIAKKPAGGKKTFTLETIKQLIDDFMEELDGDEELLESASAKIEKAIKKYTGKKPAKLPNIAKEDYLPFRDALAEIRSEYVED